MNRNRLFSTFVVFSLFLSACTTPKSTPSEIIASQPAEIAPTTEIPQLTTEIVPTPTPELTSGWSTTAGTKHELSFAFPGDWDGSSPLTFGEGEFVKHPDLPLGVTFRVELQGDPADLLAAWGSDTVGVVGIATFSPELLEDGPEVTISRLPCATRIASGEGVTGQVAYIQRPSDVMEIMWFAPTDQWEAMQETFNALLERVELWRVTQDMNVGLQTMYLHDWQQPAPPPEGIGIWFASTDGKNGLLLEAVEEIADPLDYLNAWNVEELTALELSNYTLGEGDRMDTMSGQWESRSGECDDVENTAVTYEVSFVPNKDRLIKMITYAPTETWQTANQVAFRHLLGMMTDLRP